MHAMFAASMRGAQMKIKRAERKWDSVESDRAYMSHHHTIEVIETLGQNWGFIETRPLHMVSPQEYRHTFIAFDGGKEFCITTILYVDSSTYTCIHRESQESVLSLPTEQVVRLSNADIKRIEGRRKRETEIEAALMALGFIPKPADAKKVQRFDGIVSRKDADGTIVLDYSGVRSGKIESAERVIDYRQLNKVRPDDKKSGKDG